MKFKILMNFNNFSCLTFVLKCANTPKPENTLGFKNVLIRPYCILLKIDTKFKEKLTSGLKNNIRSLANVHQTTGKFQN